MCFVTSVSVVKPSMLFKCPKARAQRDMYGSPDLMTPSLPFSHPPPQRTHSPSTDAIPSFSPTSPLTLHDFGAD